MNIYIGNLSHEVNEDDLQHTFEAYGQVMGIRLIRDRCNGESRGFGFVDMPFKGEAQSAIEGLNGTILKNETLKVNEARPPSNIEERSYRRY